MILKTLFKKHRIRQQLKKLIKQQEEMKMVIDDLNAAVAALNNTTEAVLNRIIELKEQGNQDAAISAAAASINESVSKLQNAIQ